MNFKVADLTKNSKWKLTKEVPFYPTKSGYWFTLDKSTTNAHVGTEFTVPEKRSSGDFGDEQWDRVNKITIPATWSVSGVYYPTTVNGVQGIIFFSDIKDSIELIEQPKDVAWAIKDADSGSYFSETMWFSWRERSSREYQAAKADKLSDLKKSESTQEIEESTIKFSSTALSGKVFKTLAQAKQKLMVICGYYNNSESDMLHCHAPITSIPKAWVIVEYDRVTKTEKVLDFDCTAYIKHAFELQKLTTKYGSATRDLYNKLEKKDELQKFKYFLIFTPGDINVKPLTEYLDSTNPLVEEVEQQYYGDQNLPGSYKIKADEVKTVKNLCTKDMKKSFKADSICIAIEDKIEATELTFTYYGELSSVLIDMSTLTQIVIDKK